MFLKDLLIYKHIILKNKLMITLILLFGGLAALLEGTAIILLIPILEFGVTNFSNASNNNNIAVDIVYFLFNFVNLKINTPNLLIVFAVVGIISISLVFFSNSSIHWLITNSDAKMRKTLFSSLSKLDWPFLAKYKTGEVLKALNVDPVQSSIGLFNLLTASSAILAGTAHLIFAFLLSWELTLLAIFFAILIFPLYVSQVRKGKKMAQAASYFDNELSVNTAQSIDNAKLFFSVGLREFLFNKFKDSAINYKKSKLRQEVYVESSRLVFELTAILFVAGFLYIVFVVGNWPITTGIVFIALFYRLAPKIIIMQGSLFRASNHSAWVKNWQEWNEKFIKNPAVNRGTIKTKFSDNLFLKNVSYNYPGRSNPAINDISINIKPGESVAIVGPSGHGKSTILDIISGLILPQSGTFSIDSKSIVEIDISFWQSCLGFLPQEAPIFNGSVKENIIFFDPNIADEKLLNKVAEISDSFDFIRNLPEGFDTILGERGASLSGGQRQRIGLARALYRKPKLLVLDEPTSSLDNQTTQRIISNLKSFSSKIALIIVTHRDEPLSLVDRTYKIINGKSEPLN